MVALYARRWGTDLRKGENFGVLPSSEFSPAVILTSLPESVRFFLVYRFNLSSLLLLLSPLVDWPIRSGSLSGLGLFSYFLPLLLLLLDLRSLRCSSFSLDSSDVHSYAAKFLIPSMCVFEIC